MDVMCPMDKKMENQNTKERTAISRFSGLVVHGIFVMEDTHQRHLKTPMFHLLLVTLVIKGIATLLYHINLEMENLLNGKK